MFGEHAGVKSLFKAIAEHTSNIHCKNHQFALCFAYLKNKFLTFLEFDDLLLNLFLVFKNSSIRNAIFKGMQELYKMLKLKLIKSAITRWLPHGKTVERVLNGFVPIVSSANEIYKRKKEPALKSICDDSIKRQVVATLCFLNDVILMTSKLQVFLQPSRLYFLLLPSQIEKLLVD